MKLSLAVLVTLCYREGKRWSSVYMLCRLLARQVFANKRMLRPYAEFIKGVYI